MGVADRFRDKLKKKTGSKLLGIESVGGKSTQKPMIQGYFEENLDNNVKSNKGTGLFKSGRFDDGYQFGDVTLGVLGTVGDAAAGIVQGAGGLAEGITDLAQYGIAGAVDLFGGDDFADKMRQNAMEDKVASGIGLIRTTLGIDDASFLGDFGYGVAEGVGQVGAIILTGGAAGAAGLGSVGASALTTGMVGLSSMGSGMSEAYQGGATDGQAFGYGVTKGAVDAGTELIFGGLGKGVKALGVSKGLTSVDDVFAKKLSSKMSSQFFKNATEFGVKASAEGLEEVLAGLGTAAAKKLTYMSDEELSQLVKDEKLMEQFAAGVIVSGIAQSGDLVKSTKSGRDFVSNYTQNEEKVIEAEFNSRVAEEEKNGNKLSNKEKNKIYEQVQKDMEKGYISTDTIESVLGGESYKTYHDTVNNEDSILKEYDDLGKKEHPTLADQSRYAELTDKVNEIKTGTSRSSLKTKLESEVFDLVKSEKGYLTESYNERARRGQAYEADLSKYDAKRRAVLQKAIDSGILNNTNRTHEFVDMIAKISADKGVSFDFTNNEKLKESGFAVDGKTVNGYVTKDGVTLNVQSAKSLNSVVGHEISHVLEGTELYTELQNAVMEYAKAKKDYDSRQKELTDLYKDVKDADIDAELTADLIGDYLFADPDFINNLSTKHRNVFQKIYDEIKYLLKVATAGSKEARELEKVKRAFDKAYRESGKSDTQTDGSSEATTQYSISVTDKDTIDFLDNQEHIVTYKSMQLIDGKLYPPMAAKVKGADGKYKLNNPSTLGVWQQATEDPSNIKKIKNGVGYYTLNKGDGTSIDAAYNPYEHSSNLVLNDQFESAHRRNNLVTVECIIPVSEMSSGYKAEYAKDSTGVMDWKSGVVAGQIKDNKRMVYLSRYLKPVRILSEAETASKYKDILDGTGVSVPFNVVSPSLLAELEKAGVAIDYDGSPMYQSIQKRRAEKEAKKKGAKYSLTAEQQEYFKDSVVRDENGDLKVMYHGTKAHGFTVFDHSYQKFGLFGSGFYFTDDSNVADGYSKDAYGKAQDGSGVYEAYLNIKNPIDMDAYADKEKWVSAIADTFDESTDVVNAHLEELIENMSERMNGARESVKNSDMFYIMRKVIYDLEIGKQEAGELAEDCIRSMGYDGITHIGGGRFNNKDENRHRVYIAFNPEQIKNIDNVKPTDNPDIRYSLTEDSEGTKLTKEQSEFYKDTKALDRNGNLLKVYHTTNSDFTVFDKSKKGEATGDTNTYMGFFFADDAEYMQNFPEFENGKTEAYYLNMTNPIDMTDISKEAFLDVVEVLGGDVDEAAEIYDQELSDEKDRAMLRGDNNTSLQLINLLNEMTGDADYRTFIEELRPHYDELMSKGYDGVVNYLDELWGAKEYIVLDSNQAKLTSNLNPTADADIRYSLSEDSQGRELSAEQRSYFNGSKVVDENGNLKVMYHGTPNGDFTVFKDGTYFTENKWYADLYQNPGASSISTGKVATNPKTYEVYLNIKKPFDIKDAEARNIFINDYIKGGNAVGINPYLSDAEYDKIHTIDWIEGEDLRDFLIDNGYDYDGLVLDEGAVGGYGDEVKYRGKSYVVFSPEQVKNVDNKIPTDNPDINKSLSWENEAPVRRSRNDIFGEDIMYAPIREDISKTEQIADDFAPMTEEEANALQSENIASLDDTDAPPEMEAPFYGENEDTAPSDPFAERDIKEVGKRNVKAYMYENPEVKPFFQEEANVLLGELRDTVRGERFYTPGDVPGEYGADSYGVWSGTSRHTTQDIAYLLDELGYTYDEIEKGLNAIIEDHGEENNACSKRIEFLLNDRLMNGYQDLSGYDIPADQDYINLLNEKQITEYNEEARKRFFDVADDFAPVVEATEEIAPTREYEAIKPRPEKLYGEEAQWAKNKMARADKVNDEHHAAEIMDAEPETAKKKGRGWSMFMRNFVDKQSVFETLALKTKNRNLMGKANQMHNAESSAQWLIGHGTEGVKSLNDIRAEVESTGMTKQFYEYLYHKHNVDRMNLEGRYKDVKNKPVFGYDVTAKASQDIVNQYEFAEPRFKEYAQDVYNYMNHLRKMLVDNGVISQETADLWAEMYPHYVPIRRLGDSGLNINVPLDTGRTGVNAPIKRAKGGSRDILPLFDTMAMRTQQTYKAIAKNNFGVELKNTLGSGIVKNKVSFEEVVDSIENQQDELLKKGENGQNPTFTVFENGERVTFEITEDMYDALKPTSDGLAYTNKVLNNVSKFRKGLITEYNPVFMATNAIKDAQDILINSQHAGKTYKNLPKAFYELATKGKWYTEYMENGGEQNTYFDGKSNTFKAEDSRFKKVFGMPLRAISKANNFIERAPRLAEYIASRESGASVEVAMLDAARVTTNFAAGGDVTKLLNRNGATFLNASVQGFNQQVRNIREAKANGLKGWLGLAGKFALAGLPAALLNSLVWEDDEEYEELSDYVKDNYYIVAKYGDGQFVRLPKGRTVAVIQGAIEQISNAATGDDEVDFGRFFELFMNNIAPNNPIDNNIISPIIQAASNETWYGEDLVPTRLQDLPKEEQYDESTDSLSKWLGETFGWSPYKVNYLLDQYSGGLGDVFLPMMTPEAESGDNSVFGNIGAPLKDKFTTDSVMNNQNVSDFYDTLDELTTNAKRSAATDEDVLKYKYMNSVSEEIGNLYAQKREIQNSNLADSEKYAAVKKIQKQIDAMAKDSLNAYGHVQINGSHATVGDQQFRWYEPGEDSTSEPGWKKISDKELKKQEEVTKGLGISASAYWSNKGEYDFAYEYPGKYAVARAVGGYESYSSYSSDLYDIKADKDEDGKSISGSRKEKVIDYINGLDADYGEKIILFKSEYKADDTYNSDIIDYLNSREDLSYKDIVTILKELGFTVYSDGTVRW